MNWFYWAKKRLAKWKGQGTGSSANAIKFTPRAMRALVLAREEADRLNHNYLGTEHLLLGLIKLNSGVAVNVLQKLGIDLESARKGVEKPDGTGPVQKMAGKIPYPPRMKRVIALAREDANAL